MEIAIVSQEKDTRGAIGSQGGDTGGAIRSRLGDTGHIVGSQGDTEGTAKSRGRGAIGPRGGDRRCCKACRGVDGF